jgi:cell shape-determining protein MreD
MRTATLVLVAYLLCVLVSSVWRLVPADLAQIVVPDVVALTAAYLGLTTRQWVSRAVAGAVVLGYLGDLISGAPPGMMAFTAGVMALIAHGVHRRILVRGFAMTLGFSIFVGASSAILLIIVRLAVGLSVAGGGGAIARIAGVALATGIVGGPILRLYRRIDAAFARTHRERDNALEGLTH